MRYFHHYFQCDYSHQKYDLSGENNTNTNKSEKNLYALPVLKEKSKKKTKRNPLLYYFCLFAKSYCKNKTNTNNS